MHKTTLFLILLISLFTVTCKNKATQNEKSISERVADKQAIAIKEALKNIETGKALIKNGDLICRTGYDNISLSLQNFNTQDKSYSHSGIAFIESGEVFVYHSIAGNDENPNENFLREPFDTFVNPLRKSCFGIYRYKITQEEMQKFDSSFKLLYKNHVKFDKNFDLKDDKKQYCSEAIYKCLIKSTKNRVVLPTTIRENYKSDISKYLPLKNKKFEYIALDNLYLNPFCDSIFKFKYNTFAPQY